MGLDMYLYRKPKTTKGKILCKIKNGRADEEVGYWRKANHIHAWFVNECGQGIDKCQTIPVSQKKLIELLERLNRVQKSHRKLIAEELLPPQGGFFFGRTDIDDDYWEGINESIKIISKVLKETDFETERIVYQASW